MSTFGATRPANAIAEATCAPAASEIGRRWISLLEVGDIEGVLSLYSPGARVHTGVVNFAGYQGVRLYLGQLPLLCWRPPHIELLASDHMVVIAWRPAVPGCRDWQGGMTRMRIDNGRIVEQWVASSAVAQGAA